MLSNPPFGQADLTNCERELIHLAASIQPHGVLLVLDETELRILQATANTRGILGVGHDELLGRPVSDLGGDVEVRIRNLTASFDLAEPVPLQCHTGRAASRHNLEGSIHRHPPGGLIVGQPQGCRGRPGRARQSAIARAALSRGPAF